GARSSAEVARRRGYGAGMALVRIPFRAMASDNELQLDAADPARARRAADAAIADVLRIEAKYSRYRDDSLVTRINRAAGGVAVESGTATAAPRRCGDRRLAG